VRLLKLGWRNDLWQPLKGCLGRQPIREVHQNLEDSANEFSGAAARDFGHFFGAVRLDLTICTAYKSGGLMIYAMIASKV
jgi:hypothetical protein